jgi:hypothetical protein
VADAPFTENSQATWEDFFNLLPGTPRRIVADMDAGIAAAVAASFSRRNEPAPTYHWSDLHVQCRLHNALAPLHSQPGRDVMKRLERALLSTSDWDRFVHAIRHEDQTATPMPAAVRGLRLEVIGRLRDLQGLTDLSDRAALAQHPVALAQLADDLLGGVPALLHVIVPVSSMIVDA